jgi:hypothetical protein
VHRFGCAFENLFAKVEHHHMVAQGAHKRHVVLDHQQGDAALGQTLEQTAQLFGLDVVQACGGFI